MTRIGRIYTDNHIRAHPRHPRNPCSIVYNSELNRIPATGAHVSDLKPYLEYKDSGVEWIGKVPEQKYKAKVIFQTVLTGLT
ncbi:hypothetical protein ig2599ANME_2462 [groundwater metagenome]